jgi:CRP-like cAMP-binding protein
MYSSENRGTLVANKPRICRGVAGIQSEAEIDAFKDQMRQSLTRQVRSSRSLRIAKHENIYSAGAEDNLVYFIASGQVKLLMLSSDGNECLLAIHSSGDVFGELSLAGLTGRLETATAMEDSVLAQFPSDAFLEHLATDSLLEGFVKYLAVRVAEQQQVIAHLVTVDSEQRLGKTLLQLGRKLSHSDDGSMRLDVRISHEELASMIGTTRPRISLFMQRFRNLGLIEMSAEHHLIIKGEKLTSYLDSIA